MASSCSKPLPPFRLLARPVPHISLTEKREILRPELPCLPSTPPPCLSQTQPCLFPIPCLHSADHPVPVKLPLRCCGPATLSQGSSNFLIVPSVSFASLSSAQGICVRFQGSIYDLFRSWPAPAPQMFSSNRWLLALIILISVALCPSLS